MRAFTLSVIMLLATSMSTLAFVPSTSVFAARSLSVLPMTSEDNFATAASGANIHDIPSLIEHLATDNFEESLVLLEPLLMNECVGEECKDYVGEVEAKAKKLGKTVPDTYAPKLR